MCSTPPSGPGNRGGLLADLVARFDAAAAALATELENGPPSDIPAAALPELSAAVHRSADLGRTGATEMTGAVHASGVLAVGGYVSTTTGLKAECKKCDATSGATWGRARDLAGTFAVTAAALLAGEISSGHAWEFTHGITLVVQAVPSEDRVAESVHAETIVLEVAKTGTVEDVTRAVAGRGSSPTPTTSPRPRWMLMTISSSRAARSGR